MSSDENKGFCLVGKTFQRISGEGVHVEIKSIGNNKGEVRSSVEIDASLDTVWNIITDYERFAEVVPCVSASRLLSKNDNTCRVQVAEMKLAFGLKLKAEAVVDYTEKDFTDGRIRYLEFKMIEGDFKVYEGKWGIEESEKLKTVVTYEAVLKPKHGVPVSLVATVVGKEIKTNVASIREAAERAKKSCLMHKSM